MRGVFHYCIRLTQNFVVGSRRVILVGAACCDDLACELVVRRVVGDLVSNPGAERRGTLRAEEFTIDLQEISPLVGPVIDVVVATNQLFDQLVALDLAIALVRGKF